MSDQRGGGIAWTDVTWNPVRGCSRVSEGCRNCYAERVAARFNGPGRPFEGLVRRVDGEARWTGAVRLVPERLGDPLRWRRPRRVFVNSVSDLFHEQLADELIERVFDVMVEAHWHTFQVLTKRPERMRAWAAWWLSCSSDPSVGYTAGMPPNVWLGVSVEDQRTADERIQLLLQTPAAVRWVSYEPALGPVDFRAKCGNCSGLGRCYGPDWKEERSWECKQCSGSGRTERVVGLDWIVVGGESGPVARPFDIAWARQAVRQCGDVAVPVFVKQLGARPYRARQRDDGKVVHAWDERIRLTDPKGGEQSEWPADLRTREFPR